jgi:hypothetical protein
VYRVSPLVVILRLIQTSMVDIMDILMDMKAMDMLRPPKIQTCMDILMEITSSRHSNSKRDIAKKNDGFVLGLFLVFLFNK